MKKILWAIVLSSVCALAKATTGVAFVHGTGQQSDAFNDYWTADFVNSVRQGLPNQSNFVVINCDFTQFMWADGAAGCLAGQLTSFVNSRNINDLVVITHSNGGNVMRWIMSNPTFDSRYPNIINRMRWVYAVAPSSGGTPLAEQVIAGNVFETSLGFILGFANDAVRQQQPDWMSFYNSTWLLGTAGRPALPRRFWDIVGSDVDSSPFDSDSFCGGYPATLALEVTQEFLDSCSDGFLNCSSQEAAGTLWFRDVQATNGREPLNHNQSRRPCFGLDVILRNNV